MSYRAIIGLEIHVELSTKSKMFCSCKNDPFEEKPNRNVCPICLGHPGVLPTINKKAVELVIKTGVALNCKIAKECYFERKNYFYPDLPKNYQISQYELPLCFDGFLYLPYPFSKKVRIRRIHLEEDTGKLIHEKGEEFSFIDFNRAGVPLMELVTEPDLSSGKEASLFAQELQLILRALSVSDADMEKGQMRCEVNISLVPEKSNQKLGTKVEIKNLNSFKAIEKAIEYEIKRQSEILDKGGKIIQETRGWNEKTQETFSQREKEEAFDYRYFPEPDLPPLKPSEILQIKKEDLPELPQEKRERFKKEYELSEKEVEIFVRNEALADFYEKTISELKLWLKDKKIEKEKFLSCQKLASNYLISDLIGILQKEKIKMEETKLDPENFAELVAMIAKGEISSKVAKEILFEMIKTGADPSTIVKEKDLYLVADKNFLEKIAKKVIKENQKAVSDYLSGKENAIQFLVGQIMRETRGKAEPKEARKILEKLIKEEKN